MVFLFQRVSDRVAHVDGLILSLNIFFILDVGSFWMSGPIFQGHVTRFAIIVSCQIWTPLVSVQSGSMPILDNSN